MEPTTSTPLDEAFERMAASSAFELPNGFVNHGPSWPGRSGIGRPGTTRGRVRRPMLWDRTASCASQWRPRPGTRRATTWLTPRS
jgi:hypothetical protein